MSLTAGSPAGADGGRVLVLGRGSDELTVARHVLAGPWPLADVEKARCGSAEDFTMLQEPFADPVLLETAACQARHLMATLAPQLAGLFNERLGVNLPRSFWDMALAPWLSTALEVLVDRLHRAEALVRTFGTENLEVPLWPAQSGFKFMSTRDMTFYGVLDPDWNHWLFSRLLEGRLPPAWRAVQATAPEGVQRRGTKHEESVARRLLRRAVFGLPFPRVKGFSAGESLVLSAALALNRGQTDRTLPPEAYDEPAAPPLPLGVEAPEILKLLLTMLPASISEARHEGRLPVSLPAGPPFFKTRVVSVAACDDDTYRLRMALERGRGCRLLFIQHGGDYGYVRTSVAFPLVEYSQHAFFSWGWKRHGDMAGNIVPMPHAQLHKIRNAHHETAPTLVFVGTEMATLPYTLKSMPRTTQMFGYRNDKARFFEALPEGLQAKTLYRPYFDVPSSLCDAPWVLSRFPAVHRCTGPLEAAMLHCRLLVLDHLGTTFAQALAANVPTVLFWRPELCRLTPEATPLVDELARTGMLFHDPAAAAHHVAAVWDNVADWWNGAELCKARAAFAEQFALTLKGDDPHQLLEQWCATLRSI